MSARGHHHQQRHSGLPRGMTMGAGRLWSLEEEALLALLCVWGPLGLCREALDSRVFLGQRRGFFLFIVWSSALSYHILGGGWGGVGGSLHLQQGTLLEIGDECAAL